MFLLKKATQVTVGARAESSGDVAEWLRQQYAYPADDVDGRPFLRANFVTSVDGAAAVDGRSGGLGSHGDRLLFGILRELSDAVLVGAATALAEDYGVPAARPDGSRPALVLASRSLDVPDDYAPAFDAGTLIATCAAAPRERRARLLAAGATPVDCGVDTVEPARLRAVLAERGLRRVLCEGGPRLHAELIAAGVLDQLALTLSPNLTGGDGPRIAHGAAPAGGLSPVRLRHLIGDDEGYLYFLWDRDAGATGESR
ncbi:MAG: dihydrofolate reductase family protein [Gordonia sp. (in: high G+C Gram-positive bacteria)]|uniref:dihydrofolate reductase family protein n=1 Tax=Gordonia sp. (in: high G+C Gram-positive bacteria) TaxID=84139 RepID=UPI0039E60E93